MSLDNIFLYGSYILRIIPVLTTILYIMPRQWGEIKITRNSKDHVVYFIALTLFGFSCVYLMANLASLFVTTCRITPSCGRYDADLGAFLYSFGLFSMNVFGTVLYFKEKPSIRIANLVRKRQVKR